MTIHWNNMRDFAHQNFSRFSLLPAWVRNRPFSTPALKRQWPESYENRAAEFHLQLLPIRRGRMNSGVSVASEYDNISYLKNHSREIIPGSFKSARTSVPTLAHHPIA